MKSILIISVLLMLGLKGFGQVNDSINSEKIYTIYYYGMPKYSDKVLNKIGVKYFVRWQNMGCIVDTNYDKLNDLVNIILNKRNGD